MLPNRNSVHRQQTNMKLTITSTTGTRRHFFFRLLLAIVAIALLAAPPAQAQSFYVTGNTAITGGASVVNRVDSNGTVSLFATLNLPANNTPTGTAVDSNGHLYLAANDQIFKIYPGGSSELFATLPVGSGLEGLVFDKNGNLYAASITNGVIYKIAPDGTASVFVTLPVVTFTVAPPHSSGSAPGPGAYPMGLAFDASGNLYAPNYLSSDITKISPDGTVSTFATLPAGSFPIGVAFDGNGNFYAADSQNFQISKVTPDGIVSVFADLPLNSFPGGIAFDYNGNLCVSVNGAHLIKIAPDGTQSAFATVAGGSLSLNGLAIAPLVELSPIAIEGGFPATGTVWLNIPASAAAATVSLSSGNPSFVTVPASLTFPPGVTSISFGVNTAPVAATTLVPITATFNGTTVSSNVTLSPAPTVTLTSLSGAEVNGGTPMPVTVTLNNFPRAATGAVVNLTSSDTATLQVPATVTVPYGATSATVNAATNVVGGRKGVTLKATYNGTTLTTTVFVNPIPTVTITQADYFTDTHEFKVAATTSITTNAIMTYGGSPTAAPLGTMQFETGAYRASTILATAPAQATVWNSLGGMATAPVRLKTSTAPAAGGGGGATATAFKLSIATNGKGTVTASPAASSYASGTVVTLTATPAAGSPWVGWSGAITGTANPATVTITKDTSVTANFR
jgi:sugar lactone lactonase YvrE